ncbi:MAG TPA: chemotaxis protein CheD [Desulfuromonadaceae bacterium]
MKHFLYPGTLFAAPEGHLVSTVLGSCVAVCLWDAVARMGGLNHYMLPLWNGEGLATPKYGNIAMEKLFSRMLAMGCRQENLVAKVFGGANVMGTGNEVFMIGDRNVMLAYQMLEDYGIPVAASDVGGRVGRKIVMHTATGIVLVGKGRRLAGRRRSPRTGDGEL